MKKIISAAALAIGTLMIWPTAQAGDVDVGISIGIPGFGFGGPAYYPPPPRVVVVPEPVYVPEVPYYYYDRHAYKHAEKRWKKHQKRMWKEYRRSYYGDHDYDDDDD